MSTTQENPMFEILTVPALEIRGGDVLLAVDGRAESNPFRIGALQKHVPQEKVVARGPANANVEIGLAQQATVVRRTS